MEEYSTPTKTFWIRTKLQQNTGILRLLERSSAGTWEAEETKGQAVTTRQEQGDTEDSVFA